MLTPADVWVVVPALDEVAGIAATVGALREAWCVAGVIVVDDGSADGTGRAACRAGAQLLRHDRPRGKAAALSTGIRSLPDDERPVAFLDGDLGATAGAVDHLVGPVVAGEADLTVATLPPQRGRDGAPAGGAGLVVGLSRAGILRRTGFNPEQPLSGQRCLTRAALAAALPLARGFGVETAMTIDVLRAGFRIREVPVDFAHRPTGNDLAGWVHRARQLTDVGAALARTGAGPAGRIVDRSTAAVGLGLRVVAARLPAAR